MRTRPVSFATVLLLILTLIAPLAMLPAQATARQDGGTPGDVPIEPDSGGATVEFGEELGDGGQPGGFPRALAIDGAWFQFDRTLEIDSEAFVLLAEVDGFQVLAPAPDAPFDRVFVTDGGTLARYLAEAVGEPAPSCLAQQGEFSGLSLDDLQYLFAGPEPDLTTDDLTEVGQAGGEPIWADPAASEPYPEVFYAAGGQLYRFVLLADGLPATLAGSLVLDGVVYEVVGDVTESLDPASLTPAGCAGSYPAFTSSGATESDRFVRLGERLWQFTTSETPVEPTEEPTEAPTEEPTEEPTEAPTETPPTEEPTESPTEIPPTEEPTEVPTEVPTEAPTEEPTEEPTEAPTEVPATEAPTEAPTEQPTEEPTEIPATEVPTEEPTEVPATEEPTEQPATEARETETPTEQPGEPTPTPTPSPTPRPQAPAVVPTLPPDVPSPPAVTAAAGITCAGNPGTVNDQGIPANLPTRIQYGGVAYAFAVAQAPDEAGELTVIGCAGAFEVATTDQADRSEVLYLRYGGTGPARERVYRFEASETFAVDIEVTGRAQRISLGDQVFRLTGSWVPSIYSSVTVILFVPDADAEQPETIYAVNVDSTLTGDAIAEYRIAEGDERASDDLRDAATAAGINPDLTLNGVRYVLVNVYLPVGTTTNGFVTIFATGEAGDRTLVLGRDLRRLELFIYTEVQTTGG